MMTVLREEGIGKEYEEGIINYWEDTTKALIQLGDELKEMYNAYLADLNKHYTF